MMEPEIINELLKIYGKNLIKRFKAFLKAHYIEILIIGLFTGLPYIIGQQMQTEMYEYGGDKSGGIVIAIIWFFCLVISFVFAIFSLRIFHKWGRASYRICCFVFLILLFNFYLVIAGKSAYPIGLLNPAFFVPLLIIFMLAIRGTKFFYIYLMAFIAVPISIIVIDKFYEIKFINYTEKTCKSKQPDLFYKSFEIPERYFRKTAKNEEVQSKRFWDNKNELLELLEKPKNNIDIIYWDIACSEIDDNLEEKISKTNYKIYCDDDYKRDNYDGVKTTMYYKRLIGDKTKHYFFSCESSKYRVFRFLKFSGYVYEYNKPKNKFVKIGGE